MGKRCPKIAIGRAEQSFDSCFSHSQETSATEAVCFDGMSQVGRIRCTVETGRLRTLLTEEKPEGSLPLPRSPGNHSPRLKVVIQAGCHGMKTDLERVQAQIAESTIEIKSIRNAHGICEDRYAEYVPTHIWKMSRVA